MKRRAGFLRWLLGRVGYAPHAVQCPGCGGPGGDARVAAELRASALRNVAALSEMCLTCRRKSLREGIP